MIPTHSASASLARQGRAIRFGFFLCLISIALASGCRTVTSPPTSPNGTYVSTTIVGQVTDESGVALPGVAVTAGPLGSTIATTDANGLFALHNVSAPQYHAFIIAQKAGYFDGARAAIPSVNGVTYMNLSMTAIVSAGSVDAASGGKVTLPTGATITLAPGGVVTSSGAFYTGTVTVNAKHLDPTAANFSNIFPGDLTGQATDGSSAELVSYGIILAELRGSNGEILQPASGSPATLTMPIAASQQASAPASIPLWYFDETLGMWNEQGSATKNGNVYSGTVIHFSCWNCDWKGPWGYVKGQIVCNDVPIPNVVVNLGGPGEQVITDGGGYFNKRVPADASKIQIAIQVLASDNKGLYFTNTPIPVVVTPNNTTDLGQIALNSPCPNYLTGRLEGCNLQLTPGMVVATWPGGISYSYTTDGNYKILAPAGTALTLAANAASGDVAQPQSTTAGADGAVTLAPTLIACNGSVSDVQADIAGNFGSVLTFSPDGSQIATESGTDLIIFDANTGNKLHTITSAFKSATNPNQIQFSSDGNTILAFDCSPYGGSGSTFTCWKIDGTKLTASPIAANSAVLTPDGLSVVGTDQTHGVFKYDIATNTYPATYPVPGPKYSPHTVAGLTSNGTQLVDICSGNVYVWDMNANQIVSSFKAPAMNQDSSQMSGGLRLSPDGTILGLDGYSMYFYNIGTGTAINPGNVGASYGPSFGIDPDNTNFIGQYRVGAGNTVELLKMSDGTQTHLFDAPGSFGNSSAVAISPDGKLAAAVYGTEIRVWKVN